MDKLAIRACINSECVHRHVCVYHESHLLGELKKGHSMIMADLRNTEYCQIEVKDEKKAND